MFLFRVFYMKQIVCEKTKERKIFCIDEYLRVSISRYNLNCQNKEQVKR